MYILYCYRDSEISCLFQNHTKIAKAIHKCPFAMKYYIILNYYRLNLFCYTLKMPLFSWHAK